MDFVPELLPTVEAPNLKIRVCEIPNSCYGSTVPLVFLSGWLINLAYSIYIISHRNYYTTEVWFWCKSCYTSVRIIHRVSYIQFSFVAAVIAPVYSYCFILCMFQEQQLFHWR